MTDISTFEIRLLSRESGDSWTDEALVIIDGQDRLAALGRNTTGVGSVWIGRRPEVVVGPDSPLLAADEPHDAFIARCGCGEEGCGALIARITRSGRQVVWDNIRRGSDARAEEYPIDTEGFIFDQQQYEDAILQRAGAVTEWRPTARQAAVVARRNKSWSSDDHRLRCAGFDAVGDDGLQVVAVLGKKGDADYSMLKRTFHLQGHESAEALANRVVKYLTSGAILSDDQVIHEPL